MSRSVSSGAWTTRPRFSTIVEICPLQTGATARSAIPQQRLHLVEDRGGYLVLRRLRDRSLAGWSKERHLVLVRVETDVGSRDVVEDEEVGALVGQLLPRALEAGWPVSAAKPTRSWPLRRRSPRDERTSVVGSSS